MSEDLIKIEVDGRELTARKGQMLIEVTDAAGINIPRFCYHKKLSVAANCRMCLVEVERAPKPLPACATPVMDGMKVQTRSPKAVAAQKGTMEFLLINHPLDCPVCDQGGECELQDVAIGYGGDVSQFAERKRVVKDKDIGSLIATEMTRCIHCTRCVRFGEEIANLREMGATGRGEHTEIGTYIEKSLSSEISANIIDLCPVGALTAKPSRHTGRAWEYTQHAGLGAHDGVGSNLFVHLRRGKVMRVVPRENEALNEVWLSDRDRFSYQGLYSTDRALKPTVDGAPAEWVDALATAQSRLKALIAQHGADAVGVLASPSASAEELYLLQKLARGLGINNLDHRLRQADFRDSAHDPVYPSLGVAISELEQQQAALLVGSNLRLEQPLLAHRLRKAVLKRGAKLYAVNPRAYDQRMEMAAQCVADPVQMVNELAGVAAAVAEIKGVAPLVKASISDTQRQIAQGLCGVERKVVLLGQLAQAHPAYSSLRALAVFIAQTSGAQLGTLVEGSNAAGAWLAGVVPHRLAGGKAASAVGLDAQAMLEQPRKAYVLLGAELADFANPAQAQAALAQAELVIALSAFAQPLAQVVLPIASFAESAVSLVNVEGRCQTVNGATAPAGEARPGWKVLRVLGNHFGLAGFEYVEAAQVRDELLTACAQVQANNLIAGEFSPYQADGLLRVGEVPCYSSDALVRRAPALQASPLGAKAVLAVNAVMAQELGLVDAGRARVRQAGGEVLLPVSVDDSLPNGCVAIPAAMPETLGLGAAIGPLEVTAA